MAYNIKLNAEDVEHITVVLHKFGKTDTCERLALKFNRIMARSPSLRPRFLELQASGRCMPVEEE